MSNKSLFLVRILNQNLDVEIYEITQNRLILKQTNLGLGALRGKNIDHLVLSFSLNLIARGARKVSQIKKIDNVFYFEKNLVNSKSSIHFHPAQIIQDELIQFWMKAKLWQVVQSELNALSYKKITSTIDSIVLQITKQLPITLYNKKSLHKHDVQSAFHFSRSNSEPSLENFHDLKIDINQITKSSVNFHKSNKQKIIKPQYWLIFLLILNGVLTYLYWFPPKKLLNWGNQTNDNEKLSSLSVLLNQDQHPLILDLNKILSLVVDDYNEKILNIYLENKNITIIFRELSDQSLNKLSRRFDESNWQIIKILNVDNQTIIEVSQP